MAEQASDAKRIEVREGLTVDPPVHDEETLDLMSRLDAMPFCAEGTLEPLTEISARVLRQLERTRCPPLGRHVAPQWLQDLVQDEWDTKKLLVALRDRLKKGDRETTFAMALSIVRTLGGAREDGHVLRRMLTFEQLVTVVNERGTNDAR